MSPSRKKLLDALYGFHAVLQKCVWVLVALVLVFETALVYHYYSQSVILRERVFSLESYNQRLKDEKAGLKKELQKYLRIVESTHEIP